MRNVDAQRPVSGEGEGADVERVALLLGNPVAVNLQQVDQPFQEGLLVHGGDAQPVAGTIEALDVPVHAEDVDRAVLAMEGLEALEDRLAVVQCGERGEYAHGAEGYYLRLVPFSLAVGHPEHVVGEDIAEAQPGEVHAVDLAFLGFLDFNIAHFLFL